MPISLHTHSWYSLLEGVASPTALLDQAARLGYRTLALTDSNNLYGAVSFVDEAFRRGVRPLLGARLRLGRQRCVALMADGTGYRSLSRILSRLHLEGLPWPERAVDSNNPDAVALVDLLRGDPAGLHLLVEDVAMAEALHEVFGNRLWLELVRPRSPTDAEGQGEKDLRAASRRLGLRLVASTAAHFVRAADYPVFRLLTAVRQVTLLERLPAQLSLTPDHALITPAEFRDRFRDLPEAVENTDRLAALLRSDVLPHELILPEPILPKRRGVFFDDLNVYLRRLCERGLRRRGLGADLAARQRLRQELEVIAPRQLAGYFLTVRDIARHARRRGHTMALRGSAGNSLVCYLLGITDVDPLRFRLPMERFLHTGRRDLPDIDLDFDWKVRDQIIAHVVRRYGQRHTAQICTHQFFQPRSAFREAARVHGLSGEQISALLTTLDRTLDDLLLEPTGPAIPPCRGFPLEPERWPRLVADARSLLGRPHHLSLHPGGIILTRDPIADHVPLQWAAKGVVATQLEKDGVERIGLVKIDLLGNRGLSTVDEARRLAGLPASKFPGDPALDRDPATVALLVRGDTLGVTQLESPALRHLLVQMRPHCLEDVIQALAVIRPGAAGIGMKETFIRRRNGLEPIRLVHPRLKALLDESHGLMIYEDDALCLIQALTGLPAPDADSFRKRVAKHKTDAEAATLQAEFLELCRRQNIPAEAVSELWLQLAKFNRYSFCKSHAVSYGLIAWSACWLKAHYPAAFWTAALNNNQGSYPRRVYIEAIRRAGLTLRPPCANTSQLTFSLEGDAIRVGLGAIRALPQDLQERLVDERIRHGPYQNLADLRRRIDPGPEALGLLICAGALDWTGRPRPALFMDSQLHHQRPGRPPMAELFPDHRPFDWDPTDYTPQRRLRDQWHLLGFVIGPPLFSLFRAQLPGPGAGPPLVSGPELATRCGQRVRVRGLVATARHALTADGRPLHFITLEDEQGLADVTLFPGSCPPVPYLTLGPYEATGMVEEQFGVFTLTASSFQLLPTPPGNAG